jgi:tRNA dimethylallyltransferase
MIFILGPTASGKSALSYAIARRMPVEIISIDSAQVFKHMNVGTAKPSMQERADVPHHLIDVIEPTDVYSAAQFAIDAKKLDQEIRARGRTPLLVGGTMLYVSALTQGLNDLPQANNAVRDKLNNEANEIGWPRMHQKLLDLDPAIAAKIKPMDGQRIQRALEVIELTGRPMSEQLTSTKLGINSDGEHLVISLEPSNRLVLHQRIEARLQTMFDQGLVSEVKALRARGDLYPELPSMRCVGYRQVWQKLDELQNLTEATDQQIAQTAFYDALVATRQLAKRQLTWLRANENRHIFDCLHNIDQLIQPTLALIEKHV